MNTIPLVSILVPCYNVERYLRECMDSIVAQTLKDIEIICLNDGSTDGTLSILNEYAAADSRIRIIDKPNSGYGATMNIGLANAKGKYVGIVESDDWIEKDMFEQLYTAAEKHNLDFVRCLYTIHDEVENKVEVYHFPEMYDCDVPFCPKEQKKIFYMAPAIWAALYNREFLNKNHIRFLETPGASYQDTSFAFKVYAAAKRIMVLSKSLHHYRINNNSSVSSPSKVNCVSDEYAEIRRYARETGVYEQLKELIAVISLGAYKWNYKRLTQPMRRVFIKRWSRDAREMFANGEITRHNFSKSRIRRFWLIAHCPWTYYFRKKF